MNFVNLGLALELPLLDWLQKYTFPIEENFKDKQFAENVNRKIIDDGFMFAFKNAWGLKGAKGNKLGIVQDLNRLSFL